MTKAEQFIQACTRNCSNELCAVEDKYGKKVISYREWLTPDQARRAVEIAVEQACGWLKGFMECSNLFEYQVSESESEEVIANFKNYMKGE